MRDWTYLVSQEPAREVGLLPCIMQWVLAPPRGRLKFTQMQERLTTI